MSVVRIGVLGAARISPQALYRPANAHPRAAVAAIAARQRQRAEAAAGRWGIPRVHDSYEDLLADPDIDAVYVPLPNGLHGRWTSAAIRAGKHVLCEKPFTANATEARQVAGVAATGDRVVMEAFHWRYHPMAERMIDLVRSGAIGEPRRAAAAFCFPLTSRGDIRWDPALAGGALMDAGCYPVHMLRHVLGAEPEVRSARAWERSPGIDRLTEARLRFPGAVDATVRASMWSRHVLALRLVVEGSEGTMRAFNPLAPQYLSRLSVRDRRGRTREALPRTPTYVHQLDAFVDAVQDGAPFPTDPADAEANMAVIDAIYRAAGLAPRDPTPG